MSLFSKPFRAFLSLSTEKLKPSQCPTSPYTICSPYPSDLTSTVPSLDLLQPHWPPCPSSNTQDMHSPQGLSIYSSLCPDALPPNTLYPPDLYTDVIFSEGSFQDTLAKLQQFLSPPPNVPYCPSSLFISTALIKMLYNLLKCIV